MPEPQGVDTARLGLLDEQVRWTVYTRVRPFDRQAGAWQRLPPELARAFSEIQVGTLLADVVKGSRRFRYMDAEYSLADGHSQARVELLMLPVQEHLKPIEGGRLKVVTQVPVSVSVVDMSNGEDLLGDAIQVTGSYGAISGAGRILRSPDELEAAEQQQARQNDVRQALTDAMEQVREQLEQKLLPLAKVEGVEGCELRLTGGTRHGFQRQDELVVFRPRFLERDGVRRIIDAVPVALVVCEGVHAEFSRCRVRRVMPGRSPEPGDYAVLTPGSAYSVRYR